MTKNMQDLNFLNEALPQMQDYLLSKELYWPLSASLPRLTPGAALISLTRIKATAPLEAEKLQQVLATVRLKWRSAWNNKVAREISNRYRLWADYIADCINNPEQNVDAYASEVRGRVILQLLISEQPKFSEKSSLAEMDGLLKARLHPADFLWGSELQAIFPKSDYWFLYGKL